MHTISIPTKPKQKHRENLQSHHDTRLYQSTSLNDKKSGRQKKKKTSCKGIDNFKAQLTSLTFWTHKSFNSIIKEHTIFPSTQWNTYEN